MSNNEAKISAVTLRNVAKHYEDKVCNMLRQAMNKPETPFHEPMARYENLATLLRREANMIEAGGADGAVDPGVWDEERKGAEVGKMIGIQRRAMQADLKAQADGHNGIAPGKESGADQEM